MDRMPRETREYAEYSEHEEIHEEEDVVAKRENEISRVNGIIWLILGVLEALIGLRVLLKLLAANPDNPFASFIYRISRVFVWPFFGLVDEPASDGSVLEISSLIAMLVYLLVGWGLTRLVYLIMMPTQIRHMRTVQRH